MREQNSRLKRLLAEAELEMDALREGGEGKILSPDAKRRAVDMLKVVLSVSEQLACKAVGLARSTYRQSRSHRRRPTRTPACGRLLRTYAKGYPCHGFRRAWAALRF